MKIFDRIENARTSLHLTKGEMCKRLGIGRTMMHYLKTGERDLGMKALRELEQMESEARIKAARAYANSAGGGDRAFNEHLAIREGQDFQYQYLAEKERAERLQNQIDRVKNGLLKLVQQLGGEDQ